MASNTFAVVLIGPFPNYDCAAHGYIAFKGSSSGPIRMFISCHQVSNPLPQLLHPTRVWLKPPSYIGDDRIIMHDSGKIQLWRSLPVAMLPC